MTPRLVSVVSPLIAGVILLGCGASQQHQAAATQTAVTPAVGSPCLPSPLRLSASTVGVGQPLTVSSEPFNCRASYRAGKTYRLTLSQEGGRGALLKLAVVPVRRDGAFKATVRIPPRTSPGEAFVIVVGSLFDQCEAPSGSCAAYQARLSVLPAA
jgi:hypothetical protein